MAHFPTPASAPEDARSLLRLSEEPLSLVTRARSWRKSTQADVSSFSSRLLLSALEKAGLTARL